MTEDMDNVTFYGLDKILYPDTNFFEKHNITNIEIYDARDGITFSKGLSNSRIENIYMENITEGYLTLVNSTNVTVKNFTVERIQPVLGTGTAFFFGGAGSTSKYGTWEGGHDNHAYDIYMNGTGRSGFDMSQYEYNSTGTNITVIHSGHNGIDLHGQWNVTLKNVSSISSDAENFLLTSPNGGAGDHLIHNETGAVNVRDITTVSHDIYIYDYYSHNATGSALSSNRVVNLLVVNMTSDNDGKVINHNFAKNATFLNVTGINIRGTAALLFGTGGTYGYAEDVYLIDSSFYTNNAPITLYSTKNTRMLNVYSIAGYSMYGSMTAEYSNNYYLDVSATDSNGNPIKNGKLLIESSISNLSSMNGWAKDKTTFLIGSNGRILSPVEDRENSPAITEYYKNHPQKDIIRPNYTCNIITSDGNKFSLSGITPDSSWYRKDPNVPTYTITAIIPDTSTKGPHIIGFAPSAENPFNIGDKKNFRVWADEPLTNVEWRVNGSSILKGSLNYTWTVTDKNTTIEFIGSNANGTINQVWNLGNASKPSVPDNNLTQEIKFSPADSALTRNVSETVDFSVSPDIFTKKDWYVNGVLALSNTTSISRCWSIAGAYNVTFSGSGNGEPVLHTWTVSVAEKPIDEQNKSIVSIVPQYQVVEPNKPFDLGIKIEPGTPIAGAQLDLIFNSSMASANNVTEGDLLKQNGADTIFSRGTIDNSAGTVKNIYGFILGTSNVSSSGTMATVNLTAGNRTGKAEFSLSNVLISDANSKSVPYTVTNATILIDTAPVMNSICCPKSVNEKSTLTFKVGARDADGDRLILSASGIPQGAVFNTTSGNFTWTPAVGQAGVYTITFKVSDGHLTDLENVTITVNKLNNPPAINSFEPLNGSSFSEGERIGISVNASDAEGQALNYSIRIDGVSCSNGTKYVWETDYSSSGNHIIEVVVSDGIDEVKGLHTIYISECHPRWDVDENGIVNILDVTNVSQKYGTTVSKPYPRYDINQDGAVNILDLTLVGNHFGETVN
ncbi:hypothetical protein DU62_14260 [Methanosarcina mazei]|uniref:Dockerin domain-containing protein n=1 Tax=Methanosarcina mazei TaxID=2209 RepID=A0A0F8KZ61_METMZ|nr:hypothetical protein DU46_14925 [Methanosarcina mazei]KKG79262.1 hypothetical protein DU61_01135 [Methanosarcina mazei]KKH07694.1 hypothetical protein DU62_14260 [Methanosarcina mazei]KKH09360.1 hypothetical protein DU51_15875 [Methanosarcina mazei]